MSCILTLLGLFLPGCSDYELGTTKDEGPVWDTADTADTPDTGPPTLADEPYGKVVTILLTLSDDWMDQTTSRLLLLNAVDWAVPSGTSDPRVLVLRDDDHAGEDVEDSELSYERLLDAGYDVDLVEEPDGGLGLEDLQAYDVVMFSNPGHSPEDLSTLEAFYDFSRMGRGLVLQGDDMAHFEDASAFSMESLTRLVYIDNGTEYYGHDIDNDEGDAYAVTLANNAHPVVDGIEGITFRYGNDIDTTEAGSAQVTVLATATVEGTSLDAKPAIAAYSP